MGVCKQCSHKWNFKDKMKRLWSFKQAMKCPYCGKEQYMSAKSKSQYGIIAFIPIMVYVPVSLFKLSIIFYFILSVLIALLFSIIYSNYLELSNEEEFFF